MTDTMNGHHPADTVPVALTLDSIIGAVAEQLQLHAAADAAVRKHDDAAERERAKRAAAKARLYELRDDAEGMGPAARGAVLAMLREAGVSLPPSKR